MYLQIVTPEAVVFDAEVNSVAVPGVDGEFQMLDNHAPIVSLLLKGDVKIEVASGNQEIMNKLSKNFKREEGNYVSYSIKGGVLEMKDNKAIVLAD